MGSANNLSQSSPQEGSEQSTGSCDKKCSGSVSGFQLAGETHSYTLDFVVKKGRVTLKDVTAVPHTTTTTAPTSPASEPSGTGAGSGASGGSSCPSGFRQVCSMEGSCPLGSQSVCPPGQKESGHPALMRSTSNCRCVPFFLLGDLDRSGVGAKALESERLAYDVMFPDSIKVDDVKLKLGARTCTCSFLFTVTGSHQVTSSTGRCDKKCTGRGKGLEVSSSHRVVSFDLSAKKGKVKITNPVVTQVLTTTTPISTTTTTTAGSSPTSNISETTTSTPSTDNGCLCVDQGPSRMDELTFNETGQTHVQEQIFIEETGILGNEKQQIIVLTCSLCQRYTFLHTATTQSRSTWCRRTKFS